MLNGDAHTQADGLRSLLGIREESMLDHEGARLETGIILGNLFIRIQHHPHGAVANRVNTNAPPPPHGLIPHRYEVRRFPERGPGIVRVVGVGLIKGGCGRASVHQGLEPPDFEPVVAKPARHPQALEVSNLLSHGALQNLEHDSAADVEPPPLPDLMT
jgi:hypothetical protein